MIWKNKGYEIDPEVVNRTECIMSMDVIYIAGAGLVGQELATILSEIGQKVCFVDNSLMKQKTGIDGIDVISFDEFRKNPNNIILAVANKSAENEIKKILQEILTNHNNYEIISYYKFINKILPTYLLYKRNLLYVNDAQISLTERCTLKCRKCAHACPQRKNNDNADYSYKEFTKTADSFFSIVDYIHELILIGGEPLLYKDLKKCIEYVGNHYRKQIGRLTITTNGTILPDDNLLRSIKENKGTVRISNYSDALPKLVDNYKKLCELLIAKEIPYIFQNKVGVWYDYGYDVVNRKNDYEELKKTFDECEPSFREIRGKKYYYCGAVRNVAQNMELDVDDDGLDLSELYGEEGRRIFLEYTMGYCDKGYVDMCNYCRGNDAKKFLIPIAEQM